jgi:hypothetical protein
LRLVIEKTNYNLALSQYQEIIDHHNDGIYIDEALFFRQRYKKLKETDKAKPLYEKIIFNHEDSILLCGSEKTSGNCGETLFIKKINCLIEQTV